MLPDPIATLLLLPFPVQQTSRFVSVCHSVRRYTRDHPLPYRLTLAQARVHHYTPQGTRYSQKLEEEQ
jgi:hypothetical protein